MKQYGAALCILSFTACLLKPQGILNSQGCFAFVSKSIPLVVQATGEAVDEMQTATKPLEPPSAGTATQPVQTPGSVHYGQPSGTGGVDLSVASNSEDDQRSFTCSLSDGNFRDLSPEISPGKSLQIKKYQKRPVIERQSEK